MCSKLNTFLRVPVYQKASTPMHMLTVITYTLNHLHNSKQLHT